jgi:hypothetical protein
MILVDRALFGFDAPPIGDPVARLEEHRDRRVPRTPYLIIQDRGHPGISKKS